MIRQPDVIEQEFFMLKIALGCLIILIAAMISPGYALPLDENRLETINISADEAYEDVQPGILHFKGHFLMHSSKWKLEAVQATVYGSPDRPDKVLLEGSPARFFIIRNDGDGQDTVEAEAPAMEYLRSTNTLELKGGAKLKLDDEVIHSTVIKYDIDSNRYWAGGVDGVMIEVPPVD
jgi:lipopolysaccharide transport protein LptA